MCLSAASGFGRWGLLSPLGWPSAQGDMGLQATCLLQGTVSLLQACVTEPVKWHSHWMGWAFSLQPSWLECTPTKRLFSTSSRFIRNLSGQLRAGILAPMSSLYAVSSGQFAIWPLSHSEDAPLSSCRWSLPIPWGQVRQKGVAFTVHLLQALSVH